jgi:hypothetical protein
LVISDFDTLYKALKADGPLYAYYTKSNGRGHYIVVTGADPAGEHVYTNNSWFLKGDQTFAEFLSGITEEDDEYTFACCYLVKK